MVKRKMGSTRNHAFHAWLITNSDKRLFTQITLPLLSFLRKNVARESFLSLEPARTGHFKTLFRATI